jgi:Secretion system C-terminal sorting domain
MRLYSTLLCVLVVFMAGLAIAQPSGELVIYATPNDIDVVIAADQAADSPHAIYTLASTDTPYVFGAEIIINNDVTIRGVLGEDGRPPCIQPLTLEDNSVPGHLFTFTNSDGKFVLENLYLLGISITNTVNWGDGFAVSVNGDNIKTYINNVVFEQWGQFAINFSGDWNSFWVTNCKFRGMVNTGSVYTGEAFRQRNDLGTTLVDTIVFKHNTFLAVNAYAMCSPVTGHANYVNFSHNDVVAMVKNPFFSMNITNWDCSHNIFYDTYCAGMSNGEFPWWDRVWAGGLGSTIDLDPLNKLNAFLAGIDTAQGNWSELAEAARKINVTDNIYYRSPGFDVLYASFNDTASATADSILSTPWMNDVTSAMFNDDESWPGLDDSGNLVGTNPGFGATYADMLGASGTDVPEEHGVGLIPYVQAARKSAGAAGVSYSYHQQVVDYDATGNWVPIWPLPEDADGLLAYTADLKAADGLYYGDNYWFTGEPTAIEEELAINHPSGFSLKQNYPNPFNPATTIAYNLKTAENVTLAVYNVTGQLIMTLTEGYKQAGTHNLVFDASALSSGVYYYELRAGQFKQVRKMLLVK